jgi:putative addiction module component (TIGR02574 family)
VPRTRGISIVRPTGGFCKGRLNWLFRMWSEGTQESPFSRGETFADTMDTLDMATLDISRLTPKEWLDLIGQLWDSLSPSDVQLTQAQEAELDRRLASFDEDARGAIAWEKNRRRPGPPVPMNVPRTLYARGAG